MGIEKPPTSAILWGAVAPDLALYVLTFSGVFWFGYVKQWPATKVGRHLFQDLFFHDPVWISLHNVLHSPTVLLVALCSLWLHRRFAGKSNASDNVPAERPRYWWTWFFGSCLVHTLVDIPVHHDDGPLIFWPFNWTYRFASPVSYWDPQHFGRETMIFEATLFFALLVHLIWIAPWWRRSRSVA